MAFEESKRLKQAIERDARLHGVKNSIVQLKSVKNILQTVAPSVNNNVMQNMSQKTEQYPSEAADAASRMAETSTGYEKPFPKTQVGIGNRLSPSQLTASDNLRGHIKKLEGYEHVVANDGSGNPTGGYGNVTPGSRIDDPVGRQKAAQLLEQDIAEAERK